MARRNGKTTRMCQAVALYLAEDPSRRATIVGPHVLRNKSMYRNMLHEAGADLQRVMFVSTEPFHLLGVRNAFCDDLGDYDTSTWRKMNQELDIIQHMGGYVYWGETS